MLTHLTTPPTCRISSALSPFCLQRQSLDSQLHQIFFFFFFFGSNGSSLLHEGFSLVAASGGYSPVTPHRLLTAVASFAAEDRL